MKSQCFEKFIKNVNFAECTWGKNRVVRGDCVDTKCLNVGMYRKMRVNGGSKEKVTI